MNKITKIIWFASFVIVHFSRSQTITQNFGTGTNSFSIDFVQIGNPGNAADTTGYGSVGYDYKIGKYEITNLQYTKFLNSVAKNSDPYGLYNVFMDTGHMYSPNAIIRSGTSGNFIYTTTTGFENKPVMFVSWFDAARYANWLNNGAQNGGNTENGAYSLNGTTSALNIQRNSNSLFWLPSENEWFKSAYFDPLKNGNGGYWNYPTKSDSINDTQANYDSGLLKDVDYGASSVYGTFGQGGNLWEWNGSDVTGLRPDGSALPSGAKGLRGGSAGTTADALLRDYREGASPDFEWADTTFRIAGVPEPSALSLLVVGLGGLAILRRRRS